MIAHDEESSKKEDCFEGKAGSTGACDVLSCNSHRPVLKSFGLNRFERNPVLKVQPVAFEKKKAGGTNRV